MSTQNLRFLLENEENLKRIENRIFQNEVIPEKPSTDGEQLHAHSLVFYQTIISDCVFNEVDFSGTSFSGCYFHNCTFQSCILQNIEVYKCYYKNCTFLQSRLNKAEFDETHFDQSSFLSCFFSGGSIWNSTIRDTKFKETCTAGSLFGNSQFVFGKKSISVTGYFDLEGLIKVIFRGRN